MQKRRIQLQTGRIQLQNRRIQLQTGRIQLQQRRTQLQTGQIQLQSRRIQLQKPVILEENVKCNADSVTLLCLVQCLIISYRSFSTTP